MEKTSQEEIMRKEQKLLGDMIDLTLVVGNSHELVKAKSKKNNLYENKHKWTAFVRFANKN